MKLSNEAKVGGLVAGTLVLAMAFAWALGVSNPFSRTREFYVTYNFAGGIDVGSPVRVSGIKVGRVERIEFFQPFDAKLQVGQKIALKEPGSTPEDARESANEDGKVVAPVRLKVSIRKDAAVGVREDSRFYINIAGLIGERYLEITPGSRKAKELEAGSVIAGIDPPRIDQLISQSFDLAGKIQEIIEENKGDLTRSLELLYKLSGNLNQTLAWVDRSGVFKGDLNKLVANLTSITNDVKILTAKTQTPEGEKTLKLLHDLIWRLEKLDSQEIREFFQKQGIRAKIF
jgi:phospholipid/cholesterol/gamma-HCH transport system substrate-binding protein